MTEPELKQECLERALESGPDAARYAVAFAMISLGDAIVFVLGTGDLETKNAPEYIGTKLEKIASAIDSLAEAVHRLADAHF